MAALGKNYVRVWLGIREVFIDGRQMPMINEGVEKAVETYLETCDADPGNPGAYLIRLNQSVEIMRLLNPKYIAASEGGIIQNPLEGLDEFVVTVQGKAENNDS